MEADPEQLSEAAEITGQVIDAISTAQWTFPTPCPDWNVRELVEHLVAGNDGFAAALSEQLVPPDPTAGRSADLASDYRRSVHELLDAFRQPGALDRAVSVPFGTVPGAVAVHLRTTELLVHGWDLARATGREVAFPAELAEQELAFTRSALGGIPPERKPFAPPEPVPDDAPAIDRLAACLGRSVTILPTKPG
ncbi:MAG: TIGR03086 family metal-binding protein [Acidimicrobiales bacterium]